MYIMYPYVYKKILDETLLFFFAGQGRGKGGEWGGGIQIYSR